MGLSLDMFRLVGTLIALGLIATVIAVALIFEAPTTWRGGGRVRKILRFGSADRSRST